MKKKILIPIIIVILILITTFTIYVGFYGMANDNVNNKISLLKSELINSGYNPYFIIICKKRSEKFNNLLPLSAKKSHHLNGDAIDIYVFDINNDFKFNDDDIKIIKEKILLIEKKYPSLSGGFGTYTNKGKLSRRMIHIDTRGYHCTW